MFCIKIDFLSHFFQFERMSAEYSRLQRIILIAGVVENEIFSEGIDTRANRYNTI